MFFSPELLSRRDSGFGLLWLAATLGSQSTFKKLPKKSVLTADIKQLCDLIAEPLEPLALRLSSNLMVGVVRVFKVKQELFIVDITNCVGALKKVAQDVHSKGVFDGRLELPQATARPAALTLAMEPANAVAIDFDAFISDWDHYLNIGNGKEAWLECDTGSSTPEVDTMDADYDPKSKLTEESKRRSKQKQVPPIETMRADQCTLDEDHDQFLMSTFNGPMDQGDGMMSSYDEFAFNDIYPLSSDGLDINGPEDEELSRELINAWEGCSPRPIDRVSEQPFLPLDDVPMDIDFQLSARDPHSPVDPLTPLTTVPLVPDTPMLGLAVEEGQELSPATQFSRLFLSQGSPYAEEQAHNANAHEGATNKKRNRLLFDQRTELNDEELRQARAHYVQIQGDLKRENINRCRERDSGRVVEMLVWNIPSGIQDQALATFWQGVFKTRVDARRITQAGERPPKRRRQDHDKTAAHEPVDIGLDQHQDDGMAVFPGPPYEAGIRGSSEDPGRARHASKGPLSDAFDDNLVGINLDTQEGGSISQKDSLFPWDHAAATSSSGLAGFPLPESDNMPFEAADIRMRKPQSRRGSSVPSHPGSGSHVGEGSPFPLTSGGAYENYEFDVGPMQHDAAAVADLRLADLERHSSNFLEYTKMQLQAQTDPHSKLAFGDIIPPATSTRHVAAAAFYHCLVLGTKNAFHLEQAKPYGPISISLK